MVARDARDYLMYISTLMIYSYYYYDTLYDILVLLEFHGI